MPCNLSDELVINPVEFITRAGMERSTFGYWDPVQHIFTDPNDLHNEETMNQIPQGICITAEEL